MHLDFTLGDPDAPVGHAILYFRADTGAILATYISVPPIQFDLSQFVPGFLQGALQGMDLQDAMMATPMPPIPQEVPGLDYVEALAARRRDDLVYAGAVIQGDPMRLAAETAEAARTYGERYSTTAPAGAGSSVTASTSPLPVEEPSRYASMTEGERLNELSALTGRLRDSIASGRADPDLEREMADVANSLPAKYRAQDLLRAAHVPGERGLRLASLHIERCYKLLNEDYLDLPRIDREIEAIQAEQ